VSANLHAFGSTTNRATDAGRVQDYFAHHFDMSPFPKYTWHLTWQRGDYPKLHRLAEIAKKISITIEDAVSGGRIKPHQCSLFSRSLLGVTAASFPGYVTEPPEAMSGYRHHMYGLRRHLYSWFDFYNPNHEVLEITWKVLNGESSKLQVSS